MQADNEMLTAPFAERLTAEQRSAVSEAPRARRAIVLAEALKISEADARAEIAEASGLPTATDLQIDQAAVPILPARLVRDFHIAPLTVAGSNEKQLHLATPWPPDSSRRHV